MANVQCPNCRTVFKGPTNVLLWVIGILATLSVAGCLLIVVCLATLAAIGASVEDDFEVAGTQTQRISSSAEELDSEPGFE